MPGYCSSVDSLGVKVLSFYPDNMSNCGFPALQGVVLLFDPRNGALSAVRKCLPIDIDILCVCPFLPPQIMDGVVVSDMRTAAATACAIKVRDYRLLC